MSASVVWDVEPDEMMVQIAEDYARSIHRAIVLNSDGKIKTAFTNIFNVDFENNL